MRPALEVVDPVLAQLRLEPGGPPPTRILAPLIGEHFFGHAVLRHRRAVHLQDVLGCLAAKQVQSHHVAGVIIQKSNQIAVLASQPEGEDVGLPQLVGRGALKEARLLGIALRFGFPFLEQLLLLQRAANRFPAHRQEKHPPQELADLLDAQVRMTTLEFDDFGLDHRRHLGRLTAGLSGLGLQAGFALLAVQLHPLVQSASAHPQLAGHPLDREAFLPTELDRPASDLQRMGVSVRAIRPPRRPPRGAGPLALPLNSVSSFHR